MEKERKDKWKEGKGISKKERENGEREKIWVKWGRANI